MRLLHRSLPPLTNITRRWLRRRRSRRFLIFAVGAPKTGTHSIAAMFSPSFRAAHEPRPIELIRAMLAVHSGNWSRDRFRDFLAKRDRRLHLELEATHMLGWCIRDVVELFPDARFILTVRDCRSWLDSVINQHLNFNNPRLPEFRRLRDVYHGLPAEPTTPADTVLAHYGLYTLDGYLGYWAAHTQTVLDAVPRGRLLILRTPEITHPDSLAQLARFTGVDPESLDASAGHAYTAAKHHGVIDRLPPDDLDAAIQRHCCPLMMRFFPELAP